jgi:hypothetical protein
MVKCSECGNIEILQTKRAHYWCPQKGKWIPVRKFYRPRKCGDFKPLSEEPTIAKEELQWPKEPGY